MTRSLRVIEAEPQGKNIITTLEWALDEARKGNLSSIGLAVVYRDGSIDHHWSDAPNCSLLIGSCARLQAAIIRSVDE